MLEDEIRRAGFSCSMCAKCCSGPDNEVMVSPDEIDILSAVTGLSFDAIAEPYPEWYPAKGGGKFTLGWVLRRGKDGNCLFLENKRCKVYSSRPYICRTYPFMLNEGKLLISECESCGSGETQNVEELARDLRAREAAEIREADETAVQYQNNCNIAGSTIIYDSRGAHIKQ